MVLFEKCEHFSLMYYEIPWEGYAQLHRFRLATVACWIYVYFFHYYVSFSYLVYSIRSTIKLSITAVVLLKTQLLFLALFAFSCWGAVKRLLRLQSEHQPCNRKIEHFLKNPWNFWFNEVPREDLLNSGH